MLSLFAFWLNYAKPTSGFLATIGSSTLKEGAFLKLYDFATKLGVTKLF